MFKKLSEKPRRGTKLRSAPRVGKLLRRLSAARGDGLEALSKSEQKLRKELDKQTTAARTKLVGALRVIQPVKADIVCFGMVVPAVLLVVDQLPEHNTGGLVKQASEFISDDAAIIACLMRGWKVRSALIGTALGDDARGRATRQELKRLGVINDLRLTKDMATPYEVVVSDRVGARTYFWERSPALLATLDAAGLSLIRGAKLLYVDWYDGDHILRAMDEADRRKVPVYLNMEHGHLEADTFQRYGPRARIVQAVTDPAQKEDRDPVDVLHKLLDAGAETAVVTMASDGCVAARRAEGEILRAYAPKIEVIDANGAGATFSAGLAYGHIKRWPLEEAVRFAVAAASLKCTVVGPTAFPVRTIKRLAKEIKVERVNPVASSALRSTGVLHYEQPV